MIHRMIIKIVVPVLIFAAGAVLLIYFSNEDKTFAEYDMEYYAIVDICDLSCKEGLENQNYTCVELEANGYVCKQEIILRDEDHLLYTIVNPPELGEYYRILPDTQQRLGSIIGVSFYADDYVRVSFDTEFGTDSIVVKKGQKFTSYCFEQKNVHVWTFTDIVEVFGKQYIEMHTRLAKIPEGFDCSKPIHILKRS